MDIKKEIQCFLLDLDGTVYLGGKLIDGVKEGIERMRQSARVIFLTNNSSATRDYYVKKLTAMGIEVSSDDIYTSANATCDWIAANRKDAKIYLVSSPEVKEEFELSGLNVSDDTPDTVVLTFDKTLDYKKLVTCCDLIAKGAFYIATHPDMTCPMENGVLPDIGSFIKLIEGTTGRLPDLICGKPHRIIADCVSKMTGVPLNKTAMVGDRLTTDIRFGIDNGLKSVLTLTGETTLDMYRKSGLTVDKVINSLAEWDL